MGDGWREERFESEMGSGFDPLKMAVKKGMHRPLALAELVS